MEDCPFELAILVEQSRRCLSALRIWLRNRSVEPVLCSFVPFTVVTTEVVSVSLATRRFDARLSIEGSIESSSASLSESATESGILLHWSNVHEVNAN